MLHVRVALQFSCQLVKIVRLCSLFFAVVLRNLHVRANCHIWHWAVDGFVWFLPSLMFVSSRSPRDTVQPGVVCHYHHLLEIRENLLPSAWRHGADHRAFSSGCYVWKPLFRPPGEMLCDYAPVAMVSSYSFVVSTVR